MNHFAKIAEKLSAYELDGMLLTCEANRFYASGFHSTGTDGVARCLVMESALLAGFSKILAEKLLRLWDADPAQILATEQAHDFSDI